MKAKGQALSPNPSPRAAPLRNGPKRRPPPWKVVKQPEMPGNSVERGNDIGSTQAKRVQGLKSGVLGASLDRLSAYI